MNEPGVPNRVSKAVVEAFAKSVTILVTLKQEHSLTVNLSALGAFYMSNLGIFPVVDTWEEIIYCLIAAVSAAKTSKPSDKPFVMKLTGGCPVWLAIKIYATFVFDVDKIVYAGDTIIPLG